MTRPQPDLNVGPLHMLFGNAIRLSFLLVHRLRTERGMPLRLRWNICVTIFGLWLAFLVMWIMILATAFGIGYTVLRQ